ncbi:hypothetical protein L581_1155 [Serratia fonticola AU-AP2C]|nr:hypothetical protein L581_1155 [Serratia fonticola AU-AP2C]
MIPGLMIGYNYPVFTRLFNRNEQWVMAGYIGDYGNYWQGILAVSNG